jgi:hypothetical protein
MDGENSLHLPRFIHSVSIAPPSVSKMLRRSAPVWVTWVRSDLLWFHCRALGAKVTCLYTSLTIFLSRTWLFLYEEWEDRQLVPSKRMRVTHNGPPGR